MRSDAEAEGEERSYQAEAGGNNRSSGSSNPHGLGIGLDAVTNYIVWMHLLKTLIRFADD